jgi:large subunit ribosomal protein L10
MKKAEKTKVVDSIKKLFDKSKVVILTDYKGLKMSQLSALRKQLRPLDAEFKVLKNTMINLAVKDRSIENFTKLLNGSTAVLFGYKDQVMPAKVLAKFIKDNEKPVIKGGVLDGSFADASMIASLAKLPSREVLLSRVLMGMQAPLYNFVGDCQGIIRKFVYVLNAVKEKNGVN